MDLGAALVGGGAGLIGTGANMYLAGRSADRAEAMNERNIALQREFAQNGIRWRVEDAKAAGLHPLAALGASGASFSPVTQVGDTYFPGRDIAEMGQNIGRAMDAGMTEEEKIRARLQTLLLFSQIKETDARADYYQNEIFRRNLEGNSSKGVPSVPTTGAVQVQPDKTVSADARDHAKTAGETPMFKRYKIFGDYGIDVPYSDDGPAEGMEGAGALTLTLLRNLVFRPAEFFNRIPQKWRDSLIRSTPRRQDYLYSAPSGGR